MTTKRSLADLANAFSSKTSNTNSGASWKLFFPFWKAPVDTISTVRFLPDADDDNPLGFIVENFTHELTVNGKREIVPCLKMYGKPCPICEKSARHYDKKSSEYDEDIGKAYYRKKSYIGQVLVLETPVEHDAAQLVKLIEFGPQVYSQIFAGLTSGDLDEVPYSLKGGYNFRFRKTKTGSGQNSYATSTFAPKQTDVADDLIQSIQLFNLSEYRAAELDYSALQAVLAASTVGHNSAPAPTADPAPRVSAHAAAPKAPVVAQAQETTSEENAENTEVPAATDKNKLMAELRARAAASRAAAAKASGLAGE
jgi:hypothetical protein